MGGDGAGSSSCACERVMVGLGRVRVMRQCSARLCVCGVVSRLCARATEGWQREYLGLPGPGLAEDRAGG
jgi:hypothetical protein